jgi:hypothetical protein
MNAWRLISDGNPANVDLGMAALKSLGHFDEALCDMLNYVWEAGNGDDKRNIFRRLHDGAKPSSWHWGQGGGGRGIAKVFGTIVSYNARFSAYVNDGIMPDVRHFQKGKFDPRIKDILDAINRANSEIKRAVFEFSKSIDTSDAHEVGVALFLYDESIREWMYKSMIPYEGLVQEVVQRSGPLSMPPFSKGDHAEYHERIYEITDVRLQCSGVNMEWRIGTCSLKKNGTMNEGNTSSRVHDSDTQYMTLTNIVDWEYLKDHGRWVKKETIDQL